MKPRLSKTILLILVSLVLFNITFALEDFVAYSKNQVFFVCPCEHIQDNITLINPTNISQEFFVSISGPGEGFVKISPSHFRLHPKQKAYIVSSSDIPCNTIPGSYDILVKLKTNESVKGLRQKVVVKDNCFNYSVLLGKQLSLVNITKKEKFVLEKEFPYTFCQEENAVIPLYLKNIGNYSNTFYVSLDAEKWASLHYASVELQAQQAAVLFINVYPPKSLEGDFNFSLIVTAQKQYMEKQIPISLKLNNCYNPIIADDFKKLKLNYSTIKTILPIKNTGIKNTTYVLSVKGEDWISIQPMQLFVEAGKEKEFFVQTKPSEEVKEGTYKTVLSATVRENGITYSKELKIRLIKRFAPFIFLKNIFTKLNNFFKGYFFYIFGGVICGVILLIFVIVKKRTRREEEVKPVKKKEKAEEPEFKVEKGFLKIPWGMIIGLLILAAIIYGIYLLITKFPWKRMFSWILRFLGLYKWYILGACAFLIVAILIMLLIRKIKKRREKRKAKKEEEKEEEPEQFVEEAKEAEKLEYEIEKEPRRIPWGMIIGLLILAAIFYGMYLLITKFPWKRMFSWILGFLGLYKWYFIDAFALLVVAIIIMFLIKRIKRAKEERKEREREERQLRKELKIKAKKEKIVTKRKPFKVKFIALFVIVALVAFFCVYFRSYLGVYLWYIIIGFLLMIITTFGIIILRKRKKIARPRKKTSLTTYVIVAVVLLVVVGVGFLYTIGLKFQIKEKENITFQNVTPVSVEKELTLQIYKNTQKLVNLNEFFYDPDKDKLKYVVAAPENITITIDDDGIATVMPQLDWTGTASAVFVADDGRGGLAEYKVTFIVQEAPNTLVFFNNVTNNIQQFFGMFKQYMSVYYGYVILGFGILVCLILLIKFHKPIMDFFEEEEKPIPKYKKK